MPHISKCIASIPHISLASRPQSPARLCRPGEAGSVTRSSAVCALRNLSLMELCLPTGDSRPGLMPWRGGEGSPRAAAAAKGDRGRLLPPPPPPWWGGEGDGPAPCCDARTAKGERGRLLPPPPAAAAAPIREGEGVRSFAEATGGRRSGGRGAGRGEEAGYTSHVCPHSPRPLTFP